MGIAATRAHARRRIRVLAKLSKGGARVPVGSAADENRHHEEAERENYRRNGPRGRATFAAHSIATTASRCRGGHVRDPINMPRDSGV